MKSTPELEQKLVSIMAQGHVVPRTENNASLKVSYKGAGKLVSEKWNIKIYTTGTVVCNDLRVLDDLVCGRLKEPDSSLILTQCDDAGWGSPVCGVMVGVCTPTTLLTDTVDVKFFQGELYERKEYLREYARKGLALIKQLGVTPKTHRIEICTGYVNNHLKDQLRNLRFDVRVTEIKGMLQDGLEERFREHVKEMTGKDLAYNPKKLEEKELGRAYYNVLNWTKAHAPHLLKTGWKSISGEYK